MPVVGEGLSGLIRNVMVEEYPPHIVGVSMHCLLLGNSGRRSKYQSFTSSRKQAPFLAPKDPASGVSRTRKVSRVHVLQD